MFWRRNVRWKARRWLRRHRRRIIWMAAFFSLLGALVFTGAFRPLDRSLALFEFNLRGERESARRTVVVRIDRNLDLPLEQSEIGDLLEPVRSDGASLIVFPLDAPYVRLVDGKEMPCFDDVLYVAYTRPPNLPGGCGFQLREVQRDWLNYRTRNADGRRLLAGRIVEELDVDPGYPDRFMVNFAGQMPEVSAASFVDSTAPGLFGSRIVFFTPESENDVETPSGFVANLELDAHALSSILDESEVARGGWLTPMGILLCSLGALLAIRFKHHLVGMLVMGSMSVIVHLALFFATDVFLGTAGFAAYLGVFLILDNIVPDRQEAGREVRVRLATAIKENTRRGAHRISSDPGFWPMLLERAKVLVPEVQSMGLAELPPGSWWITYQSFVGMTEDDIEERRRDVRRNPYRDSFREHSIGTTDGYLATDEVDSILVPLAVSSEVVGFWLLNHDQPRAFVKTHHKQLRRVANQLAIEIRAHQIGTRARVVEGDLTDSADAIIDASLSAMENLERDRLILEDVLGSSRVGLLMTNLFGEIIYDNSVMRALLASTGQSEPESAAELIANLIDIEPEAARARLDRVIDDGETIDLTVGFEVADEALVIDLRIGRVTRDESGREIAQGLIITATDVTSAVESDRSKLQVVEVINTRAADLLNVLAGYANVLALSDTIDPGERALVDGLREALTEFEGLVKDFDQVAGGGELRPEQSMPLSLQYTVREALRSTRNKADLTRVDVAIPDRPLVARGHPESLQNAIQLLILDSVALAPDNVDVQVRVEETDTGLVVHVSVPDVAIPNDLLQRMIKEPGAAEGMGDNGFYAARNYVQAGGGKLEASSSLKDGLKFAIKLPRED